MRSVKGFLPRHEDTLSLVYWPGPGVSGMVAGTVWAVFPVTLNPSLNFIPPGLGLYYLTEGPVRL